MSVSLLLALAIGAALGGALFWLFSRGSSSQTRGTLTQVREQLGERTEERDQLQRQLSEAEKQLATLAERERAGQERAAWLDEAEKKLRELTNTVLSEQREVLTKGGRQAFSDTLKPFADNMQEFRQKIESLNQNTAKERTELQTMVQMLNEQAGQVRSETSELTRALKGDSKMRGDWGEITLERVLENSGLSKGLEYQTQQSFGGGEEGERRFRPDAIVRLPDERDIVIDAKLTLNPWIALLEAEQEEPGEGAEASDKNRLRKAFVDSVRQQMKDLAGKQYPDLAELRTLDFTFMFVPLEAAYAFVLQEAPELVQDALKDRVALVSPTTLMPILRVVEHIWRLDRQNRNAQEIADEAAKMYSKLNSFLQSMDKVGNSLDTAREQYGKAVGQLHSGRGNLLGKVRRLSELGVHTDKPLPKRFDRLPPQEEEEQEEKEGEGESEQGAAEAGQGGEDPPPRDD